MGTLAMFPLGTVLVPGAGLPLHVFEPRYREMVRDCLAGSGTFGVVLIERGSEVGGDDVRTDVGTVAQIAESVELPDGRWALIAAGMERLRVLEWLPDDPYPRAAVEAWQDPAPGPGHADLLDAAVGRLRRCLALSAELGDRPPPATIDLGDDPVLAGYRAVATAPLGPFDRQRLLAAPSPEERATDLRWLLDELIEVQEMRLQGGGAE